MYCTWIGTDHSLNALPVFCQSNNSNQPESFSSSKQNVKSPSTNKSKTAPVLGFQHNRGSISNRETYMLQTLYQSAEFGLSRE